MSKNENKKRLATFHFPFKDGELNKNWVRFVNRVDWTPTKHSVLCELHFDEKYIIRGDKCNLKWAIKPIPTIHSKELLYNGPLTSLPAPQTLRKSPRKRTHHQDQLKFFKKTDKIRALGDLDESKVPAGFEFRRFDDHILIYKLVFDEHTNFANVLESIKVDTNLHVQLQYNRVHVPLPKWFVQGHNAQLTRISTLENFPPYIRNTAVENDNELLQELTERQYYQPKGRPPYSANMIRYALHLRYTSFQAYINNFWTSFHFHRFPY